MGRWLEGWEAFALVILVVVIVIVGIWMLRPITSTIYSHQGPQYEIQNP